MEKHFSFLSQFRLLPRQALEPGWVSWARGTKILSYELFDHERPAPAAADTAFISVEDYFRITTLIANEACS